MSNNEIGVDPQKAPRAGSVNFATWTAVIFVGHGIGMAIFVGLAGVILSVPLRRLVVPYTTLVYCGLVLAPLLYWARRSRERPKICAMRFGISMFLYLQVLLFALGIGAVKLGILSVATALDDYAVPMVVFSVLASFLVYLIARQMLRAPQSGSTCCPRLGRDRV
ncbi:MAG TPA: hypothetical protein VE996_09290 [Terriglobales bacterium]|nr:hypothetical protein [Terriglobales bacterium]